MYLVFLMVHILDIPELFILICIPPFNKSMYSGQCGHVIVSGVARQKNLSQTKLLVVCFQVLHNSEGNMVDGMHFGSQHISMNTNLFNENGVSTSKGRGCASTCVVAFYCCNALL